MSKKKCYHATSAEETMSEWTKLEPLPGNPNPCSCCPPISPALSMDSRVAVGFGSAGILKDGRDIWHETAAVAWQDFPTLQTFEDMAKEDPDHDWVAYMYGPLHGEVYQRQGDDLWVLVEKDEGFA